jgi:GTP-binding protein EngB required for normal cell division
MGANPFSSKTPFAMNPAEPKRIHLSLVSHTNIGKTTLARTLLMKDVGEVADRAHVTEDTDSYVLARDAAGNELVLWDTPGFGNSVALAKRLEGRSNPIGWFLSEVWDRTANRSFWLDQKAVIHARDISDVVLYLVNVSEMPDRAPYIDAEMKILSWLGKPAIVLLNQMGKPRGSEAEAADVERWKSAVRGYSFVRAVLPMDAFARCWVQEAALFDAIGEALPEALRAPYASLEAVWRESRLKMWRKSAAAMAGHLLRLLRAKSVAPAPSVAERVRSLAGQLGLIEAGSESMEKAQAELASAASLGLKALTDSLIEINGLEGSGTNKEILRRLESDWNITDGGVNPVKAGAAGAVLGGAAAGAAADLSTGGLSLGLGTILGGILGAIGGAGAAALYNSASGSEGVELTWSEQALLGFIVETALLYLAVAHFGRGRGQWQEGESPAFWREAVTGIVSEQKISLSPLRKLSDEEAEKRLEGIVGKLMSAVFEKLYGTKI